MIEESLQQAARRARSQVAMTVPWFADLAEGSGAAGAIGPELRAALTLATVDTALEIGAAAELVAQRARDEAARNKKAQDDKKRAQEEEKRARIAAAEQMRVDGERRRLLREQQRFLDEERTRKDAEIAAARKAQQRAASERKEFTRALNAVLGDLRLDALSPEDLAVLMQRRWADFVQVAAGNLQGLIDWISRRRSPAVAREFAERMPPQPTGDRIIAEFVTKFGAAGELKFMGLAATRASLTELAGASEVMTVSPDGEVDAGIGSRRGQLAHYAVELHRSGSLRAYEMRPETDLAGVADLWQSHLATWNVATATDDEPPPEVLEALLAVSLIPALAERFTEFAAAAIARTRGARFSIWDRLGESPAVDLVIEKSAAESERLRLGDLQAALIRHRLIDEHDDVPTLQKLAYLLGLKWDSALGLVSSPDLVTLVAALDGENRALPRIPTDKKVESPDFAAWDRLLAEIIVTLDPQGYPRFMGAPVAASDLVQFTNGSAVMGTFRDFPGTFAHRTKGEDSAEVYSDRTARLFLSGALSVYAALPGHTRLGIIDREWHELSAEFDALLQVDSFWRGVLLCCLVDLRWATRLAAEAGTRSADARASKSHRFRTWKAGTSISVDLAIVADHFLQP